MANHVLYTRKSPTEFTRRIVEYKTYQLAVIAGQELAGYGNFYVDSPYIPTSDEQLLRKGRSAKELFLNSL